MNLIPPTHGSAGASVRMSTEQEARERSLAVLEALEGEIHRMFRAELSATPHRDWTQPVEVVRSPGSEEVSIRLEVHAPTQDTTVQVAETGEVRTLSVPVSTESRIPIVANRYLGPGTDIDHFHRPDRYLTFKGWNADTGLMVFGRTA